MKRRGFTLIELLVVVAIIALLIAILLPSLGRARDTAKTVRCASNLKQVYTGITLYEAQNEGIFMPACMINSSGSFQSELWAGYDMLGPMFGTNGTGAGVSSSLGQVNVAAQIDKMLDCPCVDHNAAWGGTILITLSTSPWDRDYTYNANVGNVQSIPTVKTNGPYLLNNVKAADVPRTTMICWDDRNKNATHDYYAANDSALVPPVDSSGGSITNANGITGDSVGMVGIVHKQAKQTNCLFGDGQIQTLNPLLLLPIGSNNWVINFRLAPTGPFPFTQ